MYRFHFLRWIRLKLGRIPWYLVVKLILISLKCYGCNPGTFSNMFMAMELIALFKLIGNFANLSVLKSIKEMGELLGLWILWTYLPGELPVGMKKICIELVQGTTFIQ